MDVGFWRGAALLVWYWLDSGIAGRVEMALLYIVRDRLGLDALGLAGWPNWVVAIQ